MVAILSRIFTFTGPQISVSTVLGLCIMVLGAIVCFGARPIMNKLTGRENTEEEFLPAKIVGLIMAAAGLIIVIYLKG
ncbi:MAG: hypothetical protein J1F63_04745 [Oscillospiraceae bacterium]|nr:hypothetical protein [Oscillospiraceae bacterium]